MCGNKEGEARKAYRRYVKEGIDQGRRSELVGGGLVLSMGGWSVVKAMRRFGIREKGDERILGSSEFAEQLIEQADRQITYQVPIQILVNGAEKEILPVCKEENIKLSNLISACQI